MHSFSKFFVFFLHVFLWFNGVAEAVKGAPDLKTRHKATGKLGIELDYELAKAGAEDMIAGKPASRGKMQNRLIFMSHHKKVPKLKDDELVQIAMDAYL